jgi:hypothetical protein
MRIFDLHTSRARYELNVILIHIWRVNVKSTGGFIYTPLADFFFSHINLRHTNLSLIANLRVSPNIERVTLQWFIIPLLLHDVQNQTL